MENEMEEVEEEDKKGPIIIGLVILFLLIVAGIAFFSATTISPPKNLQAIVEGNNVVLLWDPSDSEGVIGYNVYRSGEEGVLGELLNSKPIEETTYIDTGLEEGTYFYVVRTVVEDGREDSNTDQVKAVIGNAPYGLSMVLGNGKGFSNSNEVVAKIKANKAEQCRFSVDGNNMDWFDYTEETSVYVDEGTHTISLQCRNGGGLSEEISQDITVDTKPPLISFTVLSLEGSTLTISLKAEDDGVMECNAFAGEEVIDSFTLLSGTIEKSFELPEGEYEFAIVCKDEAGNEGKATYPVVISPPEQNEEMEEIDFSVIIEGGKEETNSRNVDVEVIGKGIDVCRYTNEDIYPDYKTDWLEYKRVKSWTLSPGEGEKTVYVQCAGEGGIVEKYDTILYRKKGKKNSHPPSNNNTNNTNQSNVSFSSISYYSIKNGVDYEIKDGEVVDVREVKAIIYVEGAEYCDFIDNVEGTEHIIGSKDVVTEPETITAELFDYEGEHQLYIRCYDSNNLPSTSGEISIIYNPEAQLPPQARHLRIIGYILRDGELVENYHVTAVSDVKVEFSSKNAEEGKLWNTPFSDPYCGQMDVPGVIDSEEEASWDDSLVEGLVDFKLIPKTYVGCPQNIPPGSAMPIKLVLILDGMREVNYKVRNSNGESSIIKDEIFYDATPPELKSAEAEVIDYGAGSPYYRKAVVIETEASDNGDKYGYGLERLFIIRYKCEPKALNSQTNPIGCVVDKEIDVPYTKKYVDYPVSPGYTYKYKIKVSDFAGYYSSYKEVYVEIPYSNNSNSTFTNISFYYKKGDEYYLLEDEKAINSRDLRVYIYGNNFRSCNFIDNVEGISVIIGSSPYSTTPTVIDGEIPAYDGEHSVYVVCEDGNGNSIVSDQRAFYYDSKDPKVYAYARPHYHYLRHNYTDIYKIKLYVKAKDNHNLSYLEGNYSVISVNLSCLRKHNYSITTRPFLLHPFRFRKIFDCINVDKDNPFFVENVSGRHFKKSYTLKNISLSNSYMLYIYVFSVYVEDEATNSDFTYSNPVISHIICYKNAKDDKFKFCYIPDEYERACSYIFKKII